MKQLGKIDLCSLQIRGHDGLVSDFSLDTENVEQG